MNCHRLSYFAIASCFALAATRIIAAPPAAKSKLQPRPGAAASKPKATQPQPAQPKPKAAAECNRYALLVGVTKYPDLPVQPLAGPANDVVVMKELLSKRFDFQNTDIVTLAESEAAADHKPTRANIEREFLSLAKRAHTGDSVVILMAGHGTQQPDSDPPDPNDPEPDAMDEVFLPSDARLAEGDATSIPQGIVDDELSRWVAGIRDAGASVWIIVDSCHSGTIARGTVDSPRGARERRVAPDQLLSPKVMAAARARADRTPRTRGGAGAPEPAISGDLARIVAMYAAQPEESTIELPLPQDADEPEPHGLLTYTLSKVLTEAQSFLTYRELAERIQAAYVQAGWMAPTPFVEGADQDREVLGVATWPNRSTIKLGHQDKKLRINAGGLLGLTMGSVLAVLPPAGKAGPEKPLGYVRVIALGTRNSTVEACKYAELPANSNLPDEARCEIVFLDAGLHPLRVAIDVKKEMRQPVADELNLLAHSNPLIAPIAERATADWVLHEAADGVYLELASGLDAGDPAAAVRFGPVAIDGKFGVWLDGHLRRISRAQNLLKLVRQKAPVEQADKSSPKVAVELLKLRDKLDQQGEPVRWQQEGIVLHTGDWLGCRVKNLGEAPADVTLLFIDAGFGIKAVYPRKGVRSDNRIYPGESAVAFRGRVNDKTIGLEHLVMIAVPGEGPQVDFGALEQPTLVLARGEKSVRGLDSPLGELLQSALYGAGTRSGQDAKDFDKQQLELISWRVVAGAPAAP